MTEAIYRELDRQALDAQLNLRARWPEHQDFFASWARLSAEVRSSLPCALDLAYGERPGERLDLFPAAPGGATAPIVAFIHGGYWQSLDKGDFSFLAPPFVERGLAFASLNYDLAPAANIPEMVEEIRRAIAWLYREASSRGVDGGRIFVAGHSAGGHLATMALLTDWPRFAPDLPADLVKGVVSVSGVYELAPLALSYHQEVLHLTPAAVEAASPLRLRPLPPGLRALLAVGAEETEEFLRQQRELARHWQATRPAVTALELADHNHFSIVEDLGRPGTALWAAVERLLAVTPPP